jgi:hypothetical protein
MENDVGGGPYVIGVSSHPSQGGTMTLALKMIFAKGSNNVDILRICSV